jgi:hypothetical protein
MKLPKQIDKCDHPESRWLRLYNLLAIDLKEGVDTCQCCVFWRGFAFAVAFFAAPTIALLLGYPLAGLTIFTLLTTVCAVVTTYYGDPLK